MRRRGAAHQQIRRSGRAHHLSHQRVHRLDRRDDFDLRLCAPGQQHTGQKHSDRGDDLTTGTHDIPQLSHRGRAMLPRRTM